MGIICSRGNKSFNTAYFNNRISLFHALDGARHQVLLARKEIVQNLFTLSFTHLLQDYLLGRLCANTPKFDRLQGSSI